MLETKILNYLNYLGDSEYMAEVATSPGAVDTLIKLLQSNNEETVSYACLFITDFVLSCSQNNICKQSWKKLESAIIPQLEHLVFADNHFIRKQVIYTLGKICSYNSVPVLLHALHELGDRDPILLPRLVGELFWLGVDNRCDVIESIIVSKQYTTRWAVVVTLEEFIYHLPNQEDETFLMRYKFCNHLRQDSHPLVQAEAEYKYQVLELNRRKHKENMSKSDYKKQRKELKKIQSFLSFSSVCSQFSNYMYKRNLHTYTTEDLEGFITALLTTITANQSTAM